MCAEASTILRAVVADFLFDCWYLEMPSDNRIRHIQRCIHSPLSCARLPIGNVPEFIYIIQDSPNKAVWTSISLVTHILGLHTLLVHRSH
jgi:hypothetical protein